MDYAAKLREKGWDVLEKIELDAVPATEFRQDVWYLLPHAERGGAILTPIIRHPDYNDAIAPMAAFMVKDSIVYFLSPYGCFMEERDFERALENFQTFDDFKTSIAESASR